MFCKNCGAQISDDSVYCEVCGEKIINDVSNENMKSRRKGKRKKVTKKIFLMVFILVAIVFVGCSIYIYAFDRGYGTLNRGALTFTHDTYPPGEKKLICKLRDGYEEKAVDITIPTQLKVLWREYTVEDIGEFSESAITSVRIPGSISVIRDFAFDDCKNITEVTIDYGVTDIGRYVFSGCESLKKINIPDSVIYIGEYAFDGCKCLEEIDIPDSVEIIGYKDMGGERVADSSTEVFNGCLGLKSARIGAKEIGGDSFAGCENLTNVYLSENVEVINSDAFWECSGLESINLENVKKIEHYAFAKCKSLKNINLSNCNYLHDRAFLGCSSLESVYMPDSMVYLDLNAFVGCEKLVSLTLPRVVTREINDGLVFGYGAGDDTTFYVHKELLDMYDEDLLRSRCDNNFVVID